MVEQRNWNLLLTGEFREPKIYILKMCVLPLKSLFPYYKIILYCTSNYVRRDLQSEAVKGHIRNT